MNTAKTATERAATAARWRGDDRIVGGWDDDPIKACVGMELLATSIGSLDVG
jgi:hypothetical protein